jgi:hypothetical protein
VWADWTFHDLFDGSRNRPAAPWLLQPFGYVLTAATVVIVIWAYRAAVVGRALGIGARREPAMLVIGWIIPVISLWWPYQSLEDTVPVRGEVQPTLRWWWAAYISQGVLVLALYGIAAVTSWRLAALGLVPLGAIAIGSAVSGRRVARDVLAIHEREVTARWLDREV